MKLLIKASGITEANEIGEERKLISIVFKPFVRPLFRLLLYDLSIQIVFFLPENEMNKSISFQSIDKKYKQIRYVLRGSFVVQWKMVLAHTQNISTTNDYINDKCGITIETQTKRNKTIQIMIFLFGEIENVLYIDINSFLSSFFFSFRFIIGILQWNV